jgi:phosphoribosyl-AMP cyclohydrolase
VSGSDPIPLGVLTGGGWSRDAVIRNRCVEIVTKKEAAVSFPESAIAKLLESVAFDANGLVAAIAQRHDTGEVLMLAWMNPDAVRETLTTGRVTYWSRSRRSLWRKGETSGHIQTLRSLRIDCDGDTLLLGVEQVGAACHTNRSNCFFREVGADGLIEISAPLED